MYYTYVLLSSNDGEWYTGAASEGKARLRDHEQGQVASTRFRSPLRLIDCEARLEAVDTYRRERYLKTGKGTRYLRQRLKAWRTQLNREKLERH